MIIFWTVNLNYRGDGSSVEAERGRKKEGQEWQMRRARARTVGGEMRVNDKRPPICRTMKMKEREREREDDTRITRQLTPSIVL